MRKRENEVEALRSEKLPVKQYVNLCLPDSVESKATRGSKVNPYSFFVKNNKDTHTVR